MQVQKAANQNSILLYNGRWWYCCVAMLDVCNSCKQCADEQNLKQTVIDKLGTTRFNKRQDEVC
jgi:hypothetical protein